MTDGTIVEYGSFAVLNHQEGAPTHGSCSAKSMANLMKVLEGLRNAPGATSRCWRRPSTGTILSTTNYNGLFGDVCEWVPAGGALALQGRGQTI